MQETFAKTMNELRCFCRGQDRRIALLPRKETMESERMAINIYAVQCISINVCGIFKETRSRQEKYKLSFEVVYIRRSAQRDRPLDFLHLISRITSFFFSPVAVGKDGLLIFLPFFVFFPVFNFFFFTRWGKPLIRKKVLRTLAQARKKKRSKKERHHGSDPAHTQA